MPHVDTIVGGSLMALARIAMFYGCRTEGSRRRQLFSTFLDEIGKTVKKMEMEPDELFAAWRDGLPTKSLWRQSDQARLRDGEGIRFSAR